MPKSRGRKPKTEKYCSCRGAASGFMLFCDFCSEWFHGKCCGITQQEAEYLEGEWFCFICTRLKRVQELITNSHSKENEARHLHEKEMEKGNGSLKNQEKVRIDQTEEIEEKCKALQKERESLLIQKKVSDDQHDNIKQKYEAVLQENERLLGQIAELKDNVQSAHAGNQALQEEQEKILSCMKITKNNWERIKAENQVLQEEKGALEKNLEEILEKEKNSQKKLKQTEASPRNVMQENIKRKRLSLSLKPRKFGNISVKNSSTSS